MHHKSQPTAGSAPMETKGKVIRWARFYDLVTWLMTFGREPGIRRMTIELAGIKEGERVLDVGCGTGTLAIAARRPAGPAGEAHGIDPSAEMIAVAREKAAKAGVDAQFQTAVMEKLPFPDGHFDLVLSSLMLHHLPADVKRAGFAEVSRVLKPGGRFLAATVLSGDYDWVARLGGAGWVFLLSMIILMPTITPWVKRRMGRAEAREQDTHHI